MCNIAGYCGNRRAAPLLLEMMKKQEGFGGGYYSGIATMDGGKIHHAKVTGDFETLCRETDARDFPGSTGIAHSRSESGGDSEWAHPFIDCTGKIAYLANGHPGYFEDEYDRDSTARRLVENGHSFSSLTDSPGSNSAKTEDGRHVHSSELRCHLAEQFFAEKNTPGEALLAVAEAAPSETASLLVNTDFPGRIFGLRFNQPLMAGRTRESCYLATTAIAFPDGERMTVFPVPVLSASVFSGSGASIFPFGRFHASVCGLVPWEAASARITAILEEKQEASLGLLKRETAPLWPDSCAPQKDYAVYEILRRLHSEGRIIFESRKKPGLVEGAETSRTFIIPVP